MRRQEGPPWTASEFGESGKNGKLEKIANINLEANANEQTRGSPCKAGESGKNGKLVKIADTLLAEPFLRYICFVPRKGSARILSSSC